MSASQDKQKNQDIRYRRIASHNDRLRWRREVAGLERKLGGEIDMPTNKMIKEGVPFRHKGRLQGFMDPDINEGSDDINRAIRRRKRALRDLGPLTSLDRKQRAVLEKQVKHDKEWLRAHMPSKRVVNTPRSSSNFQKAVEQAMVEQSEPFKKVANRYKNCIRQIDPDNPGAANLETLRKR